MTTARLVGGLLALVMFYMVPAGRVWAQEGDGLTPEQIVERIVALRHELDLLLAALPADLRREVDRRLEAEAEVAVQPDAAAAAGAEQQVGVAATRPLPCSPLAVFDSNGDGGVTALDRYWRHFRLWRDDDDGVIGDQELTTLYDANVRRLAARELDPDLPGGLFTVDVGTKRGGRATLVIEADRLARGNELELVTAGGEPLNGWQALSDRSRVRRADGTVVLLSCSE